VIGRRAFVSAMTLKLLVGPLAAHAQPVGKVWRIGFLGDGLRAERGPIAIAPFREGLRELGYVEGQNVVIEERWSESRVERFGDLAADLVRLKVDVIVTHGVRGIKAAQGATKTIPIVMAVSPDPIATGLVESLARPGGNTTGMSDQVPELSEKEIQILQEAIPRLKRIAILWNEGNPGSRVTFEETRKAAAKVGLGISVVGAQTPEDLDGAIARAASGRPDALVVVHDALTVSYRAQIARVAPRHRLPTICGSTPFVDAGGLLAYGANLAGLFKRAAVFVDRIFRGAKPAEIPIEQPTTFQLRINLKTAKALGLTIPQSILARADDIID